MVKGSGISVKEATKMKYEKKSFTRMISTSARKRSQQLYSIGIFYTRERDREREKRLRSICTAKRQEQNVSSVPQSHIPDPSS